MKKNNKKKLENNRHVMNLQWREGGRGWGFNTTEATTTAATTTTATAATTTRSICGLSVVQTRTRCRPDRRARSCPGSRLAKRRMTSGVLKAWLTAAWIAWSVRDSQHKGWRHQRKWVERYTGKRQVMPTNRNKKKIFYQCYYFFGIREIMTRVH